MRAVAAVSPQPPRVFLFLNDFSLSPPSRSLEQAKYGRDREQLLNGIIVLTFLSRNFFTDLRNAPVDKAKPQFASSISPSAKQFFSSFFV